MSARISHLDEKGRARMVDVGGKEPTRRTAVARVEVVLSAATLQLVLEGDVRKGDALAVARVAGIMGGKKTSELIPLAHPLPIDAISIEFLPDQDLPGIVVEATASTHAKTGVEMEAMTAASVAALTLYDMLKSAEKGIRIDNLRLAYKVGGKSGEYKAE